MDFIERALEGRINKALERGKSVLILGPRQVGKTTLVDSKLDVDFHYNFSQAQTRMRYEKNIVQFEKDIAFQVEQFSGIPRFFIDEVQKIPAVMDVLQVFIDKKEAQFILTGSSARKLRHGCQLNLLPGRLVVFTMTSLLYEEFTKSRPSLEELLIYGSLPHIISEKDVKDREEDLFSYTTTYLEEEIRAEALVRNVGHFSRFLELAAGESGKVLNYSKISQDIGVSHTTIAHFYQILEDCLIAHRIDPITNGSTKRRLIKSPRYLFFDMGVRRACANEGVRLPQGIMGDLFEHFIGNELIRHSLLSGNHVKVRYWKDAGGPEVDYVLELGEKYIPIEVKWNKEPKLKDARHLQRFMDEHPTATKAYIISRTPQAYKLTENILVLPWQELNFLYLSP
ncbi:Uncharacterized protein SCG7109_AB_00430 [Chlamydiales bacterium SCGC AG-110-M15]|nr:Uncharacterized protein SCG7109_AB_00430 [Chlamydiales bacterium SCGC AG-110-M15]